jgi:hypothetical protein
MMPWQQTGSAREGIRAEDLENRENVALVAKMLYFLRTTALNLPQLTRAAGIVLILVGLIHLYKAPMHFEAASYIGAAFVINFVASLVAALGIWLGAPNWGWLLGAYVRRGVRGVSSQPRGWLDRFRGGRGELGEPLG